MTKIILVLVFTLLLTACGANEQIDPARLATNQTKVGQCKENHWSCIGGFVKVKGDVHTLRIAFCNGSCTDSYTIDVDVLIYGNNDFIGRLEVVVFPNDVPRWNTEAIRYAQQFLGRS